MGVLPRDLMELYQLVLQMHQSQMQYFDATAEKIYEALQHEKGTTNPTTAPRVGAPGAYEWRPMSPDTKKGGPANGAMNGAMNGMNGATIHGGNGNMINGGWEKAEEKPAHPWQPSAGPVKSAGYDKRPQTADWKAKSSPRGAPAAPNAGFPMPPAATMMDPNALAAELERCEFQRQVSGKSNPGGRAATPVRSGVHQMDTGFGRQVSTQSRSSGRGASQEPHGVLEKSHIGRTKGVSQANQLKLFMK